MTPKIFLKLFFLGDNKILSAVLAVFIGVIHALHSPFLIALLVLLTIIVLAIMTSNYRIAYNHYNWGPISQPVTNGHPE